MAAEYKKLSVIGSGSFGKVWLVNKEYSNINHVLKEISVKNLTTLERDQCLTEVEILAKCKHLNVIKYRNAFVDCENGSMCIVMEHAQSGDLQRAIDERKGVFFEESMVIEWFVQICFGLKYIHSLKILHRDLKTQNIFLTNNNIIKIGDFGISRILTTTSGYANTVIGTPFYLSPEIYQQQPYNHKSDMWAAGCVLYNMCALRHPFDSPDFSQLVPRILHGQYPPLPSGYSQLSRDLVQVLLRQDPAGRPSAAQVLCIRAVQPYVDAYVNRTQHMRERGPYSPIPGNTAKRSAHGSSATSATKSKRVDSKSRSTSSASSREQESPCQEEPSKSLESPSEHRAPLSSKPNRRMKAPREHRKTGGESPSTFEMDKENRNPDGKITPEFKKDDGILEKRIYTDNVIKRQSRSGLMHIDKNVKSAEEPKRKIQAFSEASPKQSLFREMIKRRGQPTQEDKFSDVKKKPHVNLKGGKTYVVKRAAVNRNPNEISLASAEHGNESDDQVSKKIGRIEYVEQKQKLDVPAPKDSSTQRDVCKYLWQAALKGASDSFGSQEMIRAFLEGRLGSTRVKTMFDSIKENLRDGSDFEMIPMFNCVELLDYMPLFIKLVEQDNV